MAASGRSVPIQENNFHAFRINSLTLNHVPTRLTRRATFSVER